MLLFLIISTADMEYSREHFPLFLASATYFWIKFQRQPSQKQQWGHQGNLQTLLLQVVNRNFLQLLHHCSRWRHLGQKGIFFCVFSVHFHLGWIFDHLQQKEEFLIDAADAGRHAKD